MGGKVGSMKEAPAPLPPNPDASAPDLTVFTNVFGLALPAESYTAYVIDFIDRLLQLRLACVETGVLEKRQNSIRTHGERQRKKARNIEIFFFPLFATALSHTILPLLTCELFLESPTH